MAKDGVRGRGLITALASFTLVAPVGLLLAVVGVRSGLLSVEVGYDLLTLDLLWRLSFVGAFAGVIGLILSLRDLRRLWLPGLLGAVVGLAVVGGFVWQKRQLEAGPVENVSTDLTEVPGFGQSRPDRMGGLQPAVGVEACPGAVPVPTQVAPENAVWALQEAGFEAGRAGVGRADGSRQSTWFGFRYDVVIRIRPGRTDIRVAAREGRPHGGEACRLVTEISALLQPGA